MQRDLEQEITDIKMCMIFAGTVLTITAIWIYVLRQRDFAFLAYAMYFPGACALLFSIADGTVWSFLVGACGIYQPLKAVVYSGVAVLLVYIIVEACACVALTLGWAQKVEIKKSSIHGHNKSWIYGFLRAGGEELGWRCFLLPCLMNLYQPEYALIISGVVWGLYHVPVMILLAQKLEIENKAFTILIQSCSCILAAFPHGWLAVKTGYSVWAPTVMHWYWNRYNPTVLGSIYMNSPGRLKGPQWLINGEGLNGCLVYLPVALAVVFELKYSLL